MKSRDRPHTASPSEGAIPSWHHSVPQILEPATGVDTLSPLTASSPSPTLSPLESPLSSPLKLSSSGVFRSNSKRRARSRSAGVPQPISGSPRSVYGLEKTGSEEIYEFPQASLLRKQTGVFRVNCMDCLDR